MKQTAATLSNMKTNGRIYTPGYIVGNILDLCEYCGENILGRHVVDNSCGDGAFLVEVVRRYCEAAKNADYAVPRIISELSRYIHGIEIDESECEKCRENLTKTAAGFGVTGVEWDINCGDALKINEYNGKMDYVVGNPPYVRVHNLLDNYDAVKGFSFAQNGMTDLFIVFYEIGLKMLNCTGILGYISPSSLFNSLAGSNMRKHLTYCRNIKKVVDLKHFQPFEATAYTTIMILTHIKNHYVDYYEYDEDNLAPFAISRLNYDDFIMDGSFSFGTKNILYEFKKILSRITGTTACTVKNGFATLYDGFFIGDWPFEEYTIPVIKASTGRKTKCIFPYERTGKLIPFEILAKNSIINKHYGDNAEKLKRRSLENDDLWYGFGRSQGINDVYKQKYAINALIRDIKDINLNLCEPGTGVYSGLYILTDLSIGDLENVLFTNDFIQYVIMLGKYKSGGYYTYSSKDLSRYLNYKFAEKDGYAHEQLAFS